MGIAQLPHNSEVIVSIPVQLLFYENLPYKLLDINYRRRTKNCSTLLQGSEEATFNPFLNFHWFPSNFSFVKGAYVCNTDLYWMLLCWPLNALTILIVAWVTLGFYTARVSLFVPELSCVVRSHLLQISDGKDWVFILNKQGFLAKFCIFEATVFWLSRDVGIVDWITWCYDAWKKLIEYCLWRLENYSSKEILSVWIY